VTFNVLKSISNPLTVAGPAPDRIGGIAHDSREVDHDYVFVALQGYQADGHQFIDQAINNGAKTIIHDREISNRNPEVCYLKVQDTWSVLGHLAQAYYDYPADRLNVTGVTGTNGKTTVATLTYQLLKKLGERPSLMGTNGNIIDGKKLDSRLTTADPIQLAEHMYEMVKAGSTHLAMEVSSHALNQQRTAGIPFSVAAFTNISHDHLDYHGSMEEYVNAKKRLFDQLSEEETAVVNIDDDYATTIIKDCEAEIITFGFESDADFKCEVLSHELSGLQLRVGAATLSSPLCGRFNAYNLAQTLLIGTALGYDIDAAARALEKCAGAEGRLERVNLPDKPQPTVYVDYAHTPDALENALQTLRELKDDEQKLHLVFGCGGERDREKRPRMAEIAEQFADVIMVTSDNPRGEDPDDIIDEVFDGFNSTDPVQRNSDREEAIHSVIRRADERDVVLIAGKGHETYQEIGDRQIEFDDRKIAREALESRTKTPNGEVA